MQRPTPPHPPPQFGRFQLLRRLGAGGMAEVFLAREPLPGGLSKILVLKKIRPAFAQSPAFQRMFEEEAKIAVNLNHPCVVQTFGYGHIGDVFYLTMEHVDGVDLLRLMHLAREQGQPVPPALAAYILCQVCQGLDYAHRKRDDHGEPLAIVHRDVSPQNVLLSWDGAVKLADFGIARARDTQEDEGLLKGKYAYMSPEQAIGEPLDGRSDLFSAGVVLWETATGQALFGGLPMRDALGAIRGGKVPRPSEVCPAVPPELEAIILRALRVRREERYQTARDLQRDLSHFFFRASANRGEVVDSGRLAAYIAQLVPPARRPGLLGALCAEALGSEAETSSVRRAPAEPAGQLRERRSVLIIEGVLAAADQAAPAAAGSAQFHAAADEIARQHRARRLRLDSDGFTYLLGIPLEEEHDCQEAVQLGLALIDALGRSGAALELRVGVHRGGALVTRRPSSSLGGRPYDCAIAPEALEAARNLARSARPGEVIVGSAVYRALRGSWQFLALETLVPAAEGAQPQERAPTRAYRLLAPTPRVEPAPRALRIVGRRAELALLHQALAEAAEGPWRLRRVLITGEAGVGKRTLLGAFRQSLDPTRYLALHAAVPSAQRGAPGALLQDLARDLLGLAEHEGPEETERHLQAAALVLSRAPGGAERLISALRLLLAAPAPAPVGPGGQDAVRALLAGIAGGRTTVLTVAELHWADAASLAIVEELVDQGELGLCVYASRAVVEWPEEVRQLLGRAPHRLLELRGLAEDEQEELILGRFAPEARREALPLCRRIMAKADGNPFYIGEIIDMLLEGGALQQDAGGLLRWVDHGLDIGVPAAVEAVISARLDRLPERQRECLTLLSLCQRGATRVDPGLLGALLAHDPTGDLAQLEEAGLVHRSEDGNWAIRSPLVQDVVAATLPTEERQRLQEQLLLLLASEAQTHIARTEIARSAARLP